MRPIFTLLCIKILTVTSSIAQISGVVVGDSELNPVPYANIWVMGLDLGTSSDSMGHFTLDLDSAALLKFSAVGYQTKQVHSDTLRSTVRLTADTTQLTVLSLSAHRAINTVKIGRVKKRLNQSYACGTQPWIIAKYIEYHQTYSTTPYLSKVRLQTTCDIDQARFELRIYKPADDGSPGAILHKKPILVKTQKGKNITEIDLSYVGIKFPSSGIFIAIEWLILPENSRTTMYLPPHQKEKLVRKTYEPRFGIIQADDPSPHWIYQKGRWQELNREFLLNQGQELCIQLELMD